MNVNDNCVLFYSMTANLTNTAESIQVDQDQTEQMQSQHCSLRSRRKNS